MAHWIKELTAKTDDLSLFWDSREKKEPTLMCCPLASTCMLWHMHGHKYVKCKIDGMHMCVKVRR